MTLPTGADELQRLDNVLDDAPVTPRTRRWLLQRAAIGAAGVAALSPASALAAAGRSRTSTADDIQTVGTVAITAEALAVTYLTEVLEHLHAPSKVTSILAAANQAEYDHYLTLKGLGFAPLATRFWIPDAFFGAHGSDQPDAGSVAATLEVAETLFVNAYLIGVTVFASAGKPDFARYAAEICGVEAQHLALARELGGKLPDNYGFLPYTYTSLDQIVGQLQGAGVGFGKEGSKPGRFYHEGPKGDISPEGHVVDIDNDTPQ